MGETILKNFALLLLFLPLAGCASPPRYSSVERQISPAASDTGRLFLYRSPSPLVRRRIRTYVVVDNQPVNFFSNEGVFFADLPPGQHQVWCSECIDPAARYKNLSLYETGQTINLNLMPGESRYVSFVAPQPYGDAVRGIHFEHMALIDPEKGRKEISNLPFIGHQ
jgi:hypothetical protein